MPPISRRHLLASTTAALLGAGLAACGGSGASANPPRSTLLVYLLGSNLESGGNAGTTNLLEMLAAQGSEHTRVLITTGGANKRNPGGLVSDWKTVKRFELVQGQLKELTDLGALNMDAGATLQDFLTWGVRSCPAERTLLVLWDHGNGYYGYGGDENFANKSMSLPTLASALQGFQAATGVTLDYIGFDACLMATLEVAKMLQPYARYLGASQELEPGSGWDWKAVIDTASLQPTPSVAQFGQVVAQSFHDKQLREGPQEKSLVPPLSDYVTSSLIDLARIPALLARLDDWATDVRAYYDSTAVRAKVDGGIFWPPSITQDQPQLRAQAQAQAQALPGPARAASDPAIERWKQVAMTRLRTTTFGYEPDAKSQGDQMDLRQFASLLASQGIASGPQAALVHALQEAIVFNVAGPQAAKASGLSIYFPLGQRSERQRSVYQALAMPAGYMGLIERHTQQAEKMPSVIRVAPLKTQDEHILGEVTSVYGVQLADMLQVQPVGASVVKITGSTPFASANMDGGYGLVEYDMQAWFQLGGQPLLLYTLSNQSDEEGSPIATLYGAPVRLTSTRDAQGAQPRIVLLLMNYRFNPATWQTSGEIIGAQDIDFNQPDAPPDRVDRDLYEGDRIEPIHLLYDLQRQSLVTGADGQISIAFGAPVTMAKNLALCPAPLAAGVHRLILSVTDLAGGLGFSPPLTFTKR